MLWTASTQMYSIGLARGCGADLEYGTGSNEPTGLITAATSSGLSFSSSNITANQLEEIFFAVDSIHRSHPTCSWVMSDDAWAAIRRNAPSASRPLAFDAGDQYPVNPNCVGKLFGKRVLVDNNIEGSNGSNPQSDVIFGNLSRFIVRLTGGIRIKRNLESAYVTSGQALYTALMRLDSNIAAAGDQPIVSAVLTD